MIYTVTDNYDHYDSEIMIVSHFSPSLVFMGSATRLLIYVGLIVQVTLSISKTKNS
jgi:hypothetical protein